MNKLVSGKEYPTSIIQKRLFQLAKSKEGNLCNTYLFRNSIKGTLKINALSKALDLIVERHEIFRTSYHESSNEVYQRVHDDYAFKLEVLSLEKEDDSSAVLNKITKKEIQTPFNLSNVPILRCKLVKLNAEHHVLIIVNHHISCDGWTLMLFYDELNRLYKKFSGETYDKISTPKSDYKDFTYLQNSMFSSPEGALKRDFWLNYLQDSRQPKFQKNTTVSKKKLYKGDSVTFHLKDEEYSALINLTENHTQKPSAFTVLTAIVNLLIFKKTRNPDFIVRFPIKGRSSKFDNLKNFGCFINTLFLRSNIKHEQTFSEYLGVVKKDIKQALFNKEYPAEKLIDDLPVEFFQENKESLDVVVNMLFKDVFKLELGDLEVESLPVKQEVSRFDLIFNFINTDSFIDVHIEYNSEIFDITAIDSLISEFKMIASEVLMNNDIYLKNMLSLKE